MRIGGGAVSIADVTDREARDLGFVRPIWLREIRNNRGFVRGVSQPAVSGEQGHIQLFNPAASGITGLIFLVRGGLGGTGTGTFRQFNTELTTDVGAGFNLDVGAAAAACHLRRQTNAGLLGTEHTDNRMIGNTMYDLTPLWAYELAEGEGVMFVNATANESFTVNYYWIEF